MAKKIKIINVCQKTHGGVDYFVNGNKTHLFSHNKVLKQLEKIQEGEWNSSKFTCDIQIIDKDEVIESTKKYSVRELISEDVDFIRFVIPVSSTTKPTAFFTETSGISKIEKDYFNEFFRAPEFLQAKQNNRYADCNDIIKLLKTETPTFNVLIKNLFFNEHDLVILNFINWLSNAAYQDKHQSEFFCFIGKNEEDQGQGAGKGVLQGFLSELLSGLVTKEKSETFQKEFNPHLENKKIVVFDEVNFKTLNYNKLKDITGSDLLSVEAKGKSAYEARNVSSWFLFSNESDLKNKITYADRRAFIIRPNPINNSLRGIVEKKFGDHTNFKTKLHADIPNLIHILGRCVNNRVIDPVNLITNAKMDYFKERSAISIENVNDFTKILVNKKLKAKVCELLKDYKPERYEVVIALLKQNCINRKAFNILLNNLIDMGFVKKSQDNKIWEKLKETSLKQDFELIKVDFKKAETKGYKRFLDRTLLAPKSYGKPRLKPIKSYLREIFGKRVQPSSNLEQNPTIVAIAPMILDGITQPISTNNPQVNN